MSAINFSDNNNALYYTGIQNSLQRSLECPITMEKIKEPVVDPHGHTFEKQAILSKQEKIDGQDCVQCPHTYEWIPIDRLQPNIAVVQVAQEIKEFTKELKRLNQLNPQSLPKEEMIACYKAKIIELTAIHKLDLQRLGELQLEVQQKDGQIQVLQKAIQEREIEIKQLRNQVIELQNRCDTLEERIVTFENDRKREQEEAKVRMDFFGNELRELKVGLKNKDLELENEKKRLEEKEVEIASYENMMVEVRNELKDNKQTISWWQNCYAISMVAVAGFAIMKNLNNK